MVLTAAEAHRGMALQYLRGADLLAGLYEDGVP
jgi:hypothetical protein